MANNFTVKTDNTLNIITLEGDVPANYKVPTGVTVKLENATIQGHNFDGQEILHTEYTQATLGDFLTDLIIEKHSLDQEDSSMFIEFFENGNIISLGGEIDTNYPIDPGKTLIFSYATKVNDQYVDGHTFVNDSDNIQTVGELLQAGGFKLEEFTETDSNPADAEIDNDEEITTEQNVTNDIHTNVRTVFDGDISGSKAILYEGEKIIIKSDSVTINGKPVLKAGQEEVEFYNNTKMPQKLSVNDEGSIHLEPVNINEDLIAECDNDHGAANTGFSGDPDNNDNIDLHSDDME